jgi:hypothetical protein
VKVTSCLVLTKAVKQPGLTSHHAAFRVGEFEVAISGGIWVAIRAFAAADVFLRINGWRLQRAPLLIHAEMIQMFEFGTFDMAHVEPWLRAFAIASE